MTSCEVGQLSKPRVSLLTEANCSVGKLVHIKGNDISTSNKHSFVTLNKLRRTLHLVCIV